MKAYVVIKVDDHSDALYVVDIFLTEEKAKQHIKDIRRCCDGYNYSSHEITIAFSSR